MREFHNPAQPTPAVWALAILLGLAALLAAFAARGHAVIVAARPAMNATVARGPLEIRLDFNSRIDRRRSRISLRRPDGTEADVAPVANAPPNALAGRADATIAGHWRLDWQVLSVDGHISRGEVSFSVRDGPQTP